MAPAHGQVATPNWAGAIGEDGYRAIVERVVRGLTTEPHLLLGPLEDRMRALAEAERFEEAADARDRAAALARALARQRQLDALRGASRLEVAVGGAPSGAEGRRLVFRGGLLGPQAGVEAPGPPDAGPGTPVPRHLADELACVAAWLDAESSRLRLLRCDGELALPLPLSLIHI